MKKCGILTRFTVVQAIMVTLFTASGPGPLAQPRLACTRGQPPSPHAAGVCGWPRVTRTPLVP